MSDSFAIIDLVFNSAMLIELANDNEVEEGSTDYHLVVPFQVSHLN